MLRSLSQRYRPLFEKSVVFVCLDLRYSTNLAVTKLIATNLATIVTFENERRRERQREGILAAKKAGKYKGQKTVITKKLIVEVKDLKKNGALSVTQIARLMGRCRSTGYKILKNDLNYVSKGIRKMRKLNFSSENLVNLVIDWIGFNITGLRDPEPMFLILYRICLS